MDGLTKVNGPAQFPNGPSTFIAADRPGHTIEPSTLDHLLWTVYFGPPILDRALWTFPVIFNTIKKNRSFTFSLTLFVFCIIACDNRLWFAAFFIFIPSINPGFLLVNFFVDSEIVFVTPPVVFKAGDDSEMAFFFLRRLIPLQGRFFFADALSGLHGFIKVGDVIGVDVIGGDVIIVTTKPLLFSK